MSKDRQSLLSKVILKEQLNHFFQVWYTSGVAKLFGPRAIFRNHDEGAGHT